MSFTPDHFALWTEIPVTDLDRAIAFYGTVFDTELKKDESGPNPMALFPTSGRGGVSGHLYPGQPATAFPAGLDPKGLPLGLQAIGPYLEDRTTMRFAQLLEQEWRAFQAPPAFS